MTDSTEHPENAPKPAGESAPERGAPAGGKKSRRGRSVGRSAHKAAASGNDTVAATDSPVIIVPPQPEEKPVAEEAAATSAQPADIKETGAEAAAIAAPAEAQAADWEPVEDKGAAPPAADKVEPEEKPAVKPEDNTPQTPPQTAVEQTKAEGQPAVKAEEKPQQALEPKAAGKAQAEEKPAAKAEDKARQSPAAQAGDKQDAEGKPAAKPQDKAAQQKPADKPMAASKPQPASAAPKLPPPAAAAPAAGAPGRNLILPIAALLIGLGGLGLAGYTFKYTQDRLAAVEQVKGVVAASEQKMAGTLEQARVIAAGNDETLAQLKRQLGSLPDTTQLSADHRMLVDLQQTQQKLSMRVDEVLGASRREWKLAEAEHLLRLASLRLSALQDVGSALRLVEAADGILRDQDDPASFNARTEMARVLESLRLLKPVDRAGLFLQLAALTEQVGKANTRNPEFQIGDVAQLEVDAGELEKWWNNISRYVRIDIAADEEIRPLLMGKTLEHLRLALRLNLEQAQWAVLNGRPEVYLGAIRDARTLLNQYFGLDMDANKALYDRLGELESLPVTQQIPDLSAAVNALDAYLAQRAHADLKALEDQSKARKAGGAQ